jgi:hypothetical protein
MQSVLAVHDPDIDGTQRPVVVSQVSVAEQKPAVFRQFFATQTPPWQVWVAAHSLPFGHGVPFTQRPLLGLPKARSQTRPRLAQSASLAQLGASRQALGRSVSAQNLPT